MRVLSERTKKRQRKMAERRARIVRDFNSVGALLTAKRYGITVQRVYQIVGRENGTANA